MSLAIVFSTLVTLFVSFCAGFLLFHLLKIPIPSDWNFALLLPLYVALGMACLVVVLISISMIYLDFFISCLVALLLLIGSLVVAKGRTDELRKAGRRLKDARFLLPLLLLGFSLSRFVYFTVNLGWAPYVDSQTHGMFTSLILYHKGLPSSYYPVGNVSLNPFRYPLGYHILSAFVSMLTGLYPGQSILVVGTVIVSLLPSLLYAMVYFCTKSIELSFLAFLFAFFLPGNSPALWRPSHDLLLGNFLVGTYPNMLGNMIFLVFVILAVCFNSILRCSLGKTFFLYGLLVATLAASYYPLLPFLFLFLSLRFLLQRIFEQEKSIKTSLRIFVLLAIFVVCFLILGNYESLLTATFQIDSSYLHSVYMRYRLFSFESIYSVYGIFILAAIPFSLWFLLQSELWSLGLLFWVMLIPLVIAQNEQIFCNLLWFTQPDRALILLVACSYEVILVGFRKHLNWTPYRWFSRVKFRLWLSESKKIQFEPKQLVVVFIVLLFVPSLLSHLTYSYPASYQVALPHGHDFEVIKWLVNNVDSEELVLNDRTVMGYWITSFKAMNVINDRDIILKIFLFHSLNGTYLAERTLEVNEILDSPWDYAAFDEIVGKYGLSYIYISENPISLPLTRGRSFLPFPWKNLTQEERIAAYLDNPRLELAYHSGNAAVLRVVTSQSSYGK